MADLTGTAREFETGIASSLGLLPAPPAFWSYSALKEIEACPRRYALGRASYPGLWDGRGYPQLPSPVGLFGDVVHDALDSIVKTFVAAGCESAKAPGAVEVLRDLGGYTPVVRTAVENRLSKLETNPRLSEERRRRIGRDLRDKVAEARVAVQGYLSRSTFAPGKSSSAGAASGAGGDGPAFGRRRASLGSHAEAPLASEGLRLMGRVDLLTIREHGVEITDYKTGAEDPSHQEQLKLYALLWGLDQVVNPNGVSVTGLTAAYPSRDVVFPPPDQVSLGELKTAVSARIETADTELLAERPEAKPSADNCGFCHVRHLCDEYWSAMAPDPDGLAAGAWFDCEGTVGSENGVRSWWFQSAGPGRRKLLIRTPPAGPELTSGGRVRILGLRLDDDPEVDATVASVTSATEIFAFSKTAS